MCGIAGIVDWSGRMSATALPSVQVMCNTMAHRGPDDEGLYADEHAALGMRRLSIIDLESGQQPVANEDGSVRVVFNGEIYNFEALRRDLQARGHRFRTAGDTETIVHLYEDHGPAAVEHLRGMFAFALWDSRRRTLLLARDRLGIKPLFYAPLPGGLAFASELKCLLRLPEVGRTLSWPAVRHLFTFLSTPATQSIVEGVEKLDAGHRLLVDPSGRRHVERYWDLAFEPSTAAEGDLVDELRSLLDESVRLHLRSDVPLGAFLSGGVDSSGVVGLMTRLSGRRVSTFAVGFDDTRYDELPHARHVARLYGTDHHEVVVGAQPPDLVGDIIWHLDEPFGDSSAIPTYMVARLASRHVKVVLTGDGGDELFGGYDKYLVEQRERRADRLPGVVRRALGVASALMPIDATGYRFLNHFSLGGGRRYLDASTLFPRRDQQRLFRPGAFEAMAAADPTADALEVLGSRTDSWLSSLQYWDVRHYLPLDILVKVDRMTMAHSIEARPPLLDHRLVEFAARVPASMKIREGRTKVLFKQALQGVVPEAVAVRAKQGFAAPLAGWFRGPWRDYARDVLLSRASRQRGVLDPEYVGRLLQRHARGRDLDRQLWTLVAFEQWCRSFLDSPAYRPTLVAAPVRDAAATA